MYLDNEDLKRLIQIQDVEQAINSMNNRVAIERGKINRMCGSWHIAAVTFRRQGFLLALGQVEMAQADILQYNRLVGLATQHNDRYVRRLEKNEVLMSLAARIKVAIVLIEGGDLAAGKEALARLADILPEPEDRHIEAAKRCAE